MIWHWNLRYKIWRLQSERARNARKYRKDFRVAKENGASHDDLGSILSEGGFEDDVLKDELMQLRSSYLMSIADDLLIPTPAYGGESWEYSGSGSGVKYLSAEAQRKLRAEIRKEKLDRSERWRVWLPVLASYAGAAAAWASLLWHRR